jgi:hypothetical protein
LEFREGIVDGYDTLFGGSSESGGLTRNDNFSSKWGWYSSLFGLSHGDITRIDAVTKENVHSCLTMLSFMKEKAELENQNIKSKF